MYTPVERDSEGLTRKQRIFVNSYVIEGTSAAEAARQAGYSEHSARVQGSRLLRHSAIKAALTERYDCQNAASDTTVEKTVREWARIAYANLQHLFTEDGTVLPVHEWPIHAAHAVQSVELDSEGRVDKLKLWPKTAALEAVSKYRGMFVDRHEVTVQVEAIDRNIIDVSPVAGNEPAPSVIEHDTEQQVTDEST